MRSNSSVIETLPFSFVSPAVVTSFKIVMIHCLHYVSVTFLCFKVLHQNNKITPKLLPKAFSNTELFWKRILAFLRSRKYCVILIRGRRCFDFLSFAQFLLYNSKNKKYFTIAIFPKPLLSKWATALMLLTWRIGKILVLVLDELRSGVFRPLTFWQLHVLFAICLCKKQISVRVGIGLVMLIDCWAQAKDALMMKLFKISLCYNHDKKRLGPENADNLSIFLHSCKTILNLQLAQLLQF